MFDQELYVRDKLMDMRREASVRSLRRQAADPNAEIPRTGVGLRHEVFRRIVGDEAPRGRGFAFFRRQPA